MKIKQDDSINSLGRRESVAACVSLWKVSPVFFLFASCREFSDWVCWDVPAMVHHDFSFSGKASFVPGGKGNCYAALMLHQFWNWYWLWFSELKGFVNMRVRFWIRLFSAAKSETPNEYYTFHGCGAANSISAGLAGMEHDAPPRILGLEVSNV